MLEKLIAERDRILAELRENENVYNDLSEETTLVTKRLKELEELRRKFTNSIEFLEEYLDKHFLSEAEIEKLF